MPWRMCLRLELSQIAATVSPFIWNFPFGSRRDFNLTSPEQTLSSQHQNTHTHGLLLRMLDRAGEEFQHSVSCGYGIDCIYFSSIFRPHFAARARTYATIDRRAPGRACERRCNNGFRGLLCVILRRQESLPSRRHFAGCDGGKVSNN